MRRLPFLRYCWPAVQAVLPTRRVRTLRRFLRVAKPRFPKVPPPEAVPLPETNTTPATPASSPIPTPTSPLPKQTVRLTASELEDKIKGGWIGQMVGVAWGASTEFCYRGTMIPESKVPAWSPEMINSAFDQDDLYVEIPFIETMIKKGAFCKPEDMPQPFGKPPSQPGTPTAEQGKI